MDVVHPGRCVCVYECNGCCNRDFIETVGYWNTSTILAKAAKLILPISWVDYGLDIPSSIYDSVRAITCVSVVFFWMKTEHNYQGPVLLTTLLFVHMSESKQSV